MLIKSRETGPKEEHRQGTQGRVNPGDPRNSKVEEPRKNEARGPIKSHLYKLIPRINKTDVESGPGQ